MTKLREGPDNPAKFSAKIKPILHRWVTELPALDPMAGLGTSGIPGVIHGEIEFDWARQCPGPAYVGDASNLPFPDGCFRVWFSSSTYGNRMSDHHNAQERCKPCQGTGHAVSEGQNFYVICPKCKGEGRRKYKRHTYTHYIGHKLHERNTGQMPYGKKYKILHRGIYREAWRVLEDGGIMVLNVSDFIRDKKIVRASKWHKRACLKIGFTLIDQDIAFTPRNKHGANRDLRVEYENVFLFKKVA